MLAAAGSMILACYLGYQKYQHPDECPLMRTTECKLTLFHNIVSWSASQEEKEKITRAWMEKYVRSVLLKP